MTATQTQATNGARIPITTFASATDNTAGKPISVTADELVKRLTTFTAATNKRRVRGWMPATLRATCQCGDEKCPGELGHRITENVLELYALTFDVDKMPDGSPLTPEGARAAIARLDELGLRYVVHTTHSHTPEKPALRVIVFLSRPVPSDEWPTFWKAAATHIGIHVESACCNADRFWYLPSHPPGVEPWSKIGEGKPLDVDRVLAQFGSVGGSRDPQADGNHAKERHGSNGSTREPLRTFDIDEWMATHCPGAKQRERRGHRQWWVTCPWESEHTPGSGGAWDTTAGVDAEGKPEFCCLHGHCKDVRHWRDFRRHHEPNWIPFDERTDQRLASYGLTVVEGSETGSKSDPVSPDPWTAALADALRDIRAKLGTAEKAERSPLFFDARELFTRDYQSTAWLVTGLVADGGVGVTSGEPKASTKTWSATELAIAVVTGTKAFGEYFARQGVVFYFYAEDADRQVRNRIRALLAGRGLDHAALDGRLFCCPRGQFIDVTKDEDLAWIVASVRQSSGKIDLLVLDPLRDISSAAEDKSDEMGPVMRRLRLLGELLGCTVLVVHHDAKASEATARRKPGQRMRGSGAIHGSTDSGIYISESDGNGTTVFSNVVDSQIKGARGAGRFNIELTIADDENGEAIKATWKTSRSVTRATAKATAREAAMNGDDATVFAFVSRLNERGEHPSRRSLRDHDERPIPEKRFRDAIDRLIDAGSLQLVGSEIWLRRPSESGASDE